MQTEKVIAKTRAGEWAIKKKICPVKNELAKTLEVRNNPLKYKESEDYIIWATSLGPAIQQYADVLEVEIDRTK